MLMYDYRKDVIALMQATENTSESLMQSKVALTMLINALENEETNKDFKAIKRKEKIDNGYRVQRMLSGARVLDEENEQVAFFNERKIHSLDWHTGDKVFLNQKADGANMTLKKLFRKMQTTTELQNFLKRSSKKILKAKNYIYPKTLTETGCSTKT